LKVEHAKPKAKPYTLADGNGLHLLITANGRKLWRFRYRFGGKANMLSLGSFPEVSFASARANGRLPGTARPCVAYLCQSKCLQTRGFLANNNSLDLIARHRPSIVRRVIRLEASLRLSSGLIWIHGESLSCDTRANPPRPPVDRLFGRRSAFNLGLKAA
jgi:hypothetical protein